MVTFRADLRESNEPTLVLTCSFLKWSLLLVSFFRTFSGSLADLATSCTLGPQGQLCKVSTVHLGPERRPGVQSLSFPLVPFERNRALSAHIVVQFVPHFSIIRLSVSLSGLQQDLRDVTFLGALSYFFRVHKEDSRCDFRSQVGSRGLSILATSVFLLMCHKHLVHLRRCFSKVQAENNVARCAFQIQDR